MKLNKLLEGQVDSWAKTKAAENRAKAKAEKEARKKEIDDYVDKKYGSSAPAKKSSKPTSLEIWKKVERAVSQTFPDGDPVDRLATFMATYDLQMKDLDKAVKQHDGAKSVNAYLADMWDSVGGDAIYDAEEMVKAGKKVEYSPYFNVKDGKVIPNKNPWK